MQMLRVCACHTYADAWHMDMSCLYSFSSFSVKIRKKLKSDLQTTAGLLWLKKPEMEAGE